MDVNPQNVVRLYLLFPKVGASLVPMWGGAEVQRADDSRMNCWAASSGEDGA